MKKATCLLMIFSAVVLAGCTENQRARNFGGKASVDVQKGQKVLTVTWKDDDLWILTRPMREDEKPEVLTFKQDSSFGTLSGEVTIVEQK